jgi:LCP family protein required for cell wall assembly
MPVTDDPTSVRSRPPASAGFGRAAAWTVLGTIIPGLGLWRAGRRVAGGIALTIFVLLAAGGVALAAGGRQLLVSAATDPFVLTAAAIGLAVLALLWAAVITGTYLALRPRPASPGRRVAGAALVGVLSFAVAAPLAVGAGMAWSTADFVRTVFTEEEPEPGAPTVNAADPWADRDRLTLLVIGGDYDSSRDARMSIRADSAIVASIDTRTGVTTLISLPRNTMRMPFPKASPLHRYYPNGFGPATVADDHEFYLDAMYRNVPASVPAKLFAGVKNPGAEVMKASVGEALGLPIDYYVQIDMNGFKQFVNAIGGLTVNINYPVPVGGDTDRRIPPRRYLPVGPNQHLGGGDALWYARGRYGLKDYDRMARQRCVIHAVAQQATPANLVLNFQQVLASGKDSIRTDVPRTLLAPMAELAVRIQGTKLRSLAFEHGVDGWSYLNPDFARARKRVQQTLRAAGKANHGGTTSSASPTRVDSELDARELGKNPDLDVACAYHPAK